MGHFPSVEDSSALLCGVPIIIFLLNPNVVLQNWIFKGMVEISVIIGSKPGFLFLWNTSQVIIEKKYINVKTNLKYEKKL